MKTLKNGLKQENIDSDDIETILVNYSHRNCVKVALYYAEDCFRLNPRKEARICIDLVKKWLEDERSVTKRELRVAAYAAEESSFNEIDSGELSNVNAVSCSAVRSILVKSRACYYVWLAFNNSFLEYHFDEHKRKEYRSYARLFAYEDLDFPYRKEAKAFNLDNPTDLNVFLDFLTDNYPTAITYPREEYFTNKLAKEYLKVIYQ